MTVFLNTWKIEERQPVDVAHVLSLKQDEYDLNFCLPAAVRVIENDLLKLTPYVPSLHARELFDALQPYPEMFRFWPVGPYKDVDDLVTIFELYREMSHTLVYVVLDKSPKSRAIGDNTNRVVAPISDATDSTSYPMAGTIGFLNADPKRFSVEVGHLMTFPPFQRTHVTTTAIGLLTRLALRPIVVQLESGPTSEGRGDHDNEGTAGLGLRRVQYQASPQNVGSIRAAEKLGFRVEGVCRWQRAVSAEKEAIRRPGDAADVLGGWHSTVLSLCFDDWEDQSVPKSSLTGVS